MIFPIQIADGLGVAIMVGVIPTVRSTVCDPVQPALVVAATEYTVEIIGLTEQVDPTTAPGFQVYVPPIPAPPAVNMALPPLQIIVGLETAVIVGEGFTYTVAVPLQFVPEETTAVYVPG